MRAYQKRVAGENFRTGFKYEAQLPESQADTQNRRVKLVEAISTGGRDFFQRREKRSDPKLTNTVVRGNTIAGPLRRADQGAGLTLLGKYPLETTTFTRNVVSDFATVVRLTKEFSGIRASSFGARISLNDFTSYSIAVSSDIPSMLSVDGRGNYWGLPCPQGFDPAKVQKIGLGVSDVVTDDHPYGTSVAKILEASLPNPCR